eukprot:scaffold142490_cov78-Phaeocystis_antarctica.AAC.1
MFARGSSVLHTAHAPSDHVTMSEGGPPSELWRYQEGTLSTCQQKDLLALDLAKGAAHGLD